MIVTSFDIGIRNFAIAVINTNEWLIECLDKFSLNGETLFELVDDLFRTLNTTTPYKNWIQRSSLVVIEQQMPPPRGHCCMIPLSHAVQMFCRFFVLDVRIVPAREKFKLQKTVQCPLPYMTSHKDSKEQRRYKNKQNVLFTAFLFCKRNNDLKWIPKMVPTNDYDLSDALVQGLVVAGFRWQ
jgi:hypothetical protein